ncbi:cysteine-rich venom protein helothermine-like isoform X1 [Pogona vitticeps]
MRQQILHNFLEKKVMVLLSLSVCLAVWLQQPTVKASSHVTASMNTVIHQKEIVEKHNALRRRVQPPARNMLRMEWNIDIARNAKRWASECAFKHSSARSRTIQDKSCGENLFMSSRRHSWSRAIQTWYDEVKFFRYGFGPTSENRVIGHYTQVIWYNSYQVGCGIAYCPYQPDYKYFYVCQYCPAGNRADIMNTPYKTGKPCEDCPNACDKGLCTNPCKYMDKFRNCPDLKNRWGCNHHLTKDCKASCKCTTEIK